MVEDLLDDRPLRDCRDDPELPNGAVRAVLDWQCNSRMQHKPPDQAAPNRQLLSAYSCPATTSLVGFCVAYPVDRQVSGNESESA
jgi:hypothetical protein